MKEIPLTQSKVALVDDDDYEWLSRYKWHTLRHKRRSGAGQFRKVLMHREILGGGEGDPMVDHKNRNSLDNRRENLRFADHSLNGANRSLGRNNTSGYKGVTAGSYKQPFIAQIKINRKSINLGGFATAKEAAARYNEAALEAFGEFAALNIID
jgi:hypothetical protein